MSNNDLCDDSNCQTDAPICHTLSRRNGWSFAIYVQARSHADTRTWYRRRDDGVDPAAFAGIQRLQTHKAAIG